MAVELAGIAVLLFWVGVIFATGGGLDPIGTLIGVAMVVARVVPWWFRTYTLTHTHLHLDHGILQRTHRVVPFTRIQQVDLRQSLVPRVLSLAELTVETAADGGHSAVTLRWLDRGLAEELRDILLAEQRRMVAGSVALATGAGDGARDGDLPPPPGSMPAGRAEASTPLVSLGAGELLAAGATSSVVTGATALAAVPVALVAAAVGNDRGGPLLAIALLVLVGSGVTLAIAALGAIGHLVQLWEFELRSVGDDLEVTFGLFDRRQHTMPRRRLQHARVVDNPVRRALGIVSVQLHSAAPPGRTEGQASHLEIPYVRRPALGELLDDTMGSGGVRVPELQPRPPAARRRAVVRRTALTAVLAIGLAIGFWPAGAGLLPLALVGLAWGGAAHRYAGSSLDGSILALAAGVVVHHLDLIPVARLQSARTTSNPLQRRSGLATLHLDVAGRSTWSGVPLLGDLGAEEAERARVETTRPRP